LSVSVGAQSLSLSSVPSLLPPAPSLFLSAFPVRPPPEPSQRLRLLYLLHRRRVLPLHRRRLLRHRPLRHRLLSERILPRRVLREGLRPERGPQRLRRRLDPDHHLRLLVACLTSLLPNCFSFLCCLFLFSLLPQTLLYRSASPSYSFPTYLLLPCIYQRTIFLPLKRAV
jgi:hypothetical protein